MAPARPGEPAMCIPQSGSNQFVVGLPAGHGWDRGDWVLLSLLPEGFDKPVPVAMAVVVAPYADLAKVHVLYQTEAKSLDGAKAQRVNKDEQARLGKYVGRIAQVDLARVRIDLGAQDNVTVGDVYEVLSERDHAPVGRLQVTEVGEQWAWAKPIGLGSSEQLRQGLDAVYSKDGKAGQAEPAMLILVVNFDPHQAASTIEGGVGQGFAKDLADALQKGAEGTRIRVRYDAKERVQLGAGEAEGHKEAQLIGKRFGADVVVWGSMRCDKRACAQPRFTVVAPKALQQRSYGGAELWFDRDDAGFKFKGEAPADRWRWRRRFLGRWRTRRSGMGTRAITWGRR